MALLKASGYTTQYVQGTLTQAQAQPLILSMFAGAYRYIGCLVSGAQVSDPANDPTLLGIAENHYWVEYASSPRGRSQTRILRLQIRSSGRPTA